MTIATPLDHVAADSVMEKPTGLSVGIPKEILRGNSVFPPPQIRLKNCKNWGLRC